MGVNFLGNEYPNNEKITKPKVELYIPPDEIVGQKEATKELPQAESAQPIEGADESIDLAERVKRQERLVRVGIIVGVALLLGGVGTGVGIYFTTRSARPVVVEPGPIIEEPEEDVEEEVLLPEPGEPEEEEPPQPGLPPALADTPLAPLRGALVTFKGSNTVFLVENNGELRLAHDTGVVFENGQRYEEISKALIYLLVDKWKNVRKGAEDVVGQVDFDPRVLTISELLPYIN